MVHRKQILWFRNSAPYINAHRGRTFVLVLGGEAVQQPNFANIIHDIALLHSLGVRLILVHGSRPQIEERQHLAGLHSKFHNGVRITDGAAMEHVIDAAGALRAQFEALLSMGLPNSPKRTWTPGPGRGGGRRLVTRERGVGRRRDRAAVDRRGGRLATAKGRRGPLRATQGTLGSGDTEAAGASSRWCPRTGGCPRPSSAAGTIATVDCVR